MAKLPARIFPPIPKPYCLPFFYASISSFWAFYRVDTRRLTPFLKGTGLLPAELDGTGIVSVDLQSYTGHSGQYLEQTNEVELNVLAYPESRYRTAPRMSLADYVHGDDQTQTIGGFRVYVPCDNRFAIGAGRDLFGEAKFATTFNYDVPADNNPGRTLWSWTTHDPAFKPPADPAKYKPRARDIIFTLEADLRGLKPVTGHLSPMVLYSMLPGGKLVGDKGNTGRLIGSHWNILSVYDSYPRLGPKHRRAARIRFGTSPHPMRRDMQRLIGTAPPAAVMIYQTPPAATESLAYYVNP